ncbi:MAG: hypothetical protein IT370_32135 [Deltaproteobacteria bacterium]|nr:hypothetical protein [Deltaproteobacteria bacterium]
MVQEDAAALADVLAAPEDDAPRHAYGKLLLQRKDPRGDFIITQLALAAMHRRQALGVDRAPLELRARQLLDAHRAAWSAPVAKLTDKPSFRRGFIDGVKLTPAQFVARADELFRVAPILHLDLVGHADLAAFFASPHLARIVSLNFFDQDLGAEGARQLAASPHLGALAWLDLGYCGIGEAGLEALLASPNLPRLTWVNLVNNGFTDPCDQPGGVDGDTIYSFDTPANQTELEARHGRRRWLHWRPSDNQYVRPDPVMFAGVHPAD